MRKLLLAAGLMGIGGPAAAQQVLYTPVPPKGSAYVRFVNALDGPVKVSPDFLPAQTLGAGAADRVSAYAVVEHVQGRAMAVDAGDGARSGHATLGVAPGSFVTVILRAAGAAGIAVTEVVDQTEFNQTRAHLAFYNATTDCPAAALTLLPAKASVFADVAPGTAKTRSVNPVTATVVAACGGGQAASVALNGLEAGGMYSVWLMTQAPDQRRGFISRDSTLPWTP
jgi:alginate O-acetyltransferase complex protein AlgF